MRTNPTAPRVTYHVLIAGMGQVDGEHGGLTGALSAARTRAIDFRGHELVVHRFVDGVSKSIEGRYKHDGRKLVTAWVR